MSTLLALPVPLPSTSITLGQITTNPLSASSDSLKPSVSPEFIKQATQSKQEDAESTAHITINDPLHFFDTVRHDPTTQQFLRTTSQQNKPIQFVASLQICKAPSPKRAAVKHEPIAEDTTTPQPHLHLPFRRVDSASNMTSSDKSRLEEGSILAVQLRKVKCRIGAVDEPHCISDVDYVWSYHSLDDEEDDLQLAIGLGKPLDEREWRELAGITEQQGERDANQNWSYDYEDSDDGLGGF